MFRELRELLESLCQQNAGVLLQLPALPAAVAAICDVKEAASQQFVRLNDDKARTRPGRPAAPQRVAHAVIIGICGSASWECWIHQPPDVQSVSMPRMIMYAEDEEHASCFCILGRIKVH